jgi:cytochrome b561
LPELPLNRLVNTLRSATKSSLPSPSKSPAASTVLKSRLLLYVFSILLVVSGLVSYSNTTGLAAPHCHCIPGPMLPFRTLKPCFRYD